MEKDTRPWGDYKVLDQSEITSHYPYKVKTIRVKPNQKFSLQYHKDRVEHWIVVDGEGVATLGDDMIPLSRGKYIFVNYNQIHRITAGSHGITFVEVQHGSQCSETDIVRLEDDFGRI